MSMKTFTEGQRVWVLTLHGRAGVVTPDWNWMWEPGVYHNFDIQAMRYHHEVTLDRTRSIQYFDDPHILSEDDYAMEALVA